MVMFLHMCVILFIRGVWADKFNAVLKNGVKECGTEGETVDV